MLKFSGSLDLNSCLDMFKGATVRETRGSTGTAGSKLSSLLPAVASLYNF